MGIGPGPKLNTGIFAEKCVLCRKHRYDKDTKKPMEVALMQLKKGGKYFRIHDLAMEAGNCRTDWWK